MACLISSCSPHERHASLTATNRLNSYAHRITDRTSCMQSTIVNRQYSVHVPVSLPYCRRGCIMTKVSAMSSDYTLLVVIFCARIRNPDLVIPVFRTEVSIGICTPTLSSSPSRCTSCESNNVVTGDLVFWPPCGVHTHCSTARNS